MKKIKKYIQKTLLFPKYLSYSVINMNLRYKRKRKNSIFIIITCTVNLKIT